MPTLDNNFFLGVDPGASGGTALIDAKRNVIWLEPTPSTTHEAWEIYQKLKDKYLSLGVYAVAEKVHAMPSQGAVSMFSFGTRFGEMLMALTASEVPHELVSPQEWQKEFRIPKKQKKETGTQYKTRILITAQRMFPSPKLWAPLRTKKLQLAVCDALLIAEFCRRKYGNASERKVRVEK